MTVRVTPWMSRRPVAWSGSSVFFSARAGSAMGFVSVKRAVGYLAVSSVLSRTYESRASRSLASFDTSAVMSAAVTRVPVIVSVPCTAGV